MRRLYRQGLALLTAMVLAAGLLPAPARAIDSGLAGPTGNTWTLDDEGVLTISGTGDMYNFSPGHPWSPSAVKKVIIEDGVTNIGAYAFEQCPQLTDITIPSSVTNIGECAFSFCSQLTDITIPDGVTSIGGGAFGECSRLSSITIPDSVTSIGGWAFKNCSQLSNITIPNSVTSIGDGAFAMCNQLSSITIPDGVTSIGARVFMGTGLSSITIPDSVTSIGNEAFYMCHRLSSITISDSVTSIGDRAFGACSIPSITIPDSVTSIGVEAFRYCQLLTSVTLESGVQYISDSAFEDCQKLESVTIPSTVTVVGDGAFQNCTALSNVTFLGNAPQIMGSPFSGAISPTFRVPYGNSTWEGKMENYGVTGTALWLFFGPTSLSAAEAEIPAEGGTLTITSSNLPFSEEASTVSNYELEGGSFTVTQAEKTEEKAVRLTLSGSGGSARAGTLSIRVKPAVFSAELTDENAVPLTAAVVGGISIADAETPAPDPAPDPAPVPDPGPARRDDDDDDDDDEPAPAPAAPELPGLNVAPPPSPQEESPLQGALKTGTDIRDWIERIEVPDYAARLYQVLSPREEDSPGYLERDVYFTMSEGEPEDGRYVLESVEQVDFDLADLFTGGTPSLGISVFENDDFYRVDASAGERQVDYRALQMGDVVRTGTYNGVFITSMPKTASFDQDKKTTCSYISTVFQAFDRDHPEVFWLSGKCRVRIPSVNGTAYFFLVLADSEGFTMRAPAWTAEGAVAEGIRRRDQAAEGILSSVRADTPAEMIRQFNRYLTEHNQYNTTPDLTTIGNEPHECLSALEGRIGANGPVCDGYSRAFKLLCDRRNIPCILENGYAKVVPDSQGSLHMWNAVQLSGTWFGVDVTWNDPTVKGATGAKSGRENEEFLLVGSSTIIRGMAFSASHPATNQASGDGVAFTNGPQLSAAAFSSLTANAGFTALPFVDVDWEAWCYDPVSYVYQWNLMQGTAPDRFAPENSTNRQQLWMILARLDGRQPRNMAAARKWAVKRGITDGGDPGGVLTREQLAAVLYRYCGGTGTGSLEGFADAGSVAGYAEKAMGWAVSQGILKGMADGTIQPKGVVTRAQMAAVLERFCLLREWN